MSSSVFAFWLPTELFPQTFPLHQWSNLGSKLWVSPRCTQNWMRLIQKKFDLKTRLKFVIKYLAQDLANLFLNLYFDIDVECESKWALLIIKSREEWESADGATWWYPDQSESGVLQLVIRYFTILQTSTDPHNQTTTNPHNQTTKQRHGLQNPSNKDKLQGVPKKSS